MAKYSYWLTGEGLIKIRGYARDGLTDIEIAKQMRISRQTLSAWRKKFREIDEALKESKEVVDRKVEMSLFDRATGMKVTLKKPFKVKKAEYDEKTGRKIREEEEIVYADEEEYIPPDTKAITFWLINRKPETWKQRVELERVDNGESAGVIQIVAAGEIEEGDVIDGEYKEADTEDAGTKDTGKKDTGKKDTQQGAGE